MDATKKFEKLITDKKEIEGLPPSALGMFAQAAVSKVLTASERCVNFHVLFWGFSVVDAS